MQIEFANICSAYFQKIVRLTHHASAVAVKILYFMFLYLIFRIKSLKKGYKNGSGRKNASTQLLLYILSPTYFIQAICKFSIYFFFSTIYNFCINMICFNCTYGIISSFKLFIFLYYLTISQFISFR